MYFWHVFVGCPGAANDLHVLGVSTLSTKYMLSHARTETFNIGAVEHTGAFFLADGIYPDYAYLMKTYSSPGPQQRDILPKSKRG